MGDDANCNCGQDRALGQPLPCLECTRTVGFLGGGGECVSRRWPSDLLKEAQVDFQWCPVVLFSSSLPTTLSLKSFLLLRCLCPSHFPRIRCLPCRKDLISSPTVPLASENLCSLTSPQLHPLAQSVRFYSVREGGFSSPQFLKPEITPPNGHGALSGITVSWPQLQGGVAPGFSPHRGRT